jgi:hypothetical protein
MPSPETTQSNDDDVNSLAVVAIDGFYSQGNISHPFNQAALQTQPASHALTLLYRYPIHRTTLFLDKSLYVDSVHMTTKFVFYLLLRPKLTALLFRFIVAGVSYRANDTLMLHRSLLVIECGQFDVEESYCSSLIVSSNNTLPVQEDFKPTPGALEQYFQVSADLKVRVYLHYKRRAAAFFFLFCCEVSSSYAICMCYMWVGKCTLVACYFVGLHYCGLC